MEFVSNVYVIPRSRRKNDCVTKCDFLPQADWEIPDKKPDPSWPQNGVIEFSNYQTRYRGGLDLVLRGINCSIKKGEKVGLYLFH